MQQKTGLKKKRETKLPQMVSLVLQGEISAEEMEGLLGLGENDQQRWIAKNCPKTVDAEEFYREVPKRRWADIAFQLARKLQGDDDALGAMEILMEEDKILTNWGF